jgi:LPS-assembly protein
VVTSSRVRRIAFLLLVLAATWASPRKAQAQQPGKAPQRQPRAPLAVPSDEIRLRADRQETVEKGHLHAEGFVDLQSGELRIQSDKLDYYETDKPDGTKARRVVADGNVVLLRGDERIAGAHLEMDLDTSHAVMTDALGYVQPGVYVEARRIERIDADTYRVEGAKFTSCAQPNPRWGFTASSAVIEVDDKIKASNVLFRVKAVPALYFPYLIYPIHRDQRSTGLLIPHFGYSTLRGFDVGDGFFWAMGRSFDQTFYFDNYSNFGYGFGHEFRYAAAAPSRGTFKTYVFDPKLGGNLDYDLDWSALQALPHKFRASLAVRQFSNQTFQQQFQDNFNLATSRSRRSSLSVSGALAKSLQLQVVADSNDTFFGDSTTTQRRLPSLKLSQTSHKLGKSGLVFGWEARGEYLGRNFSEDQVDYYPRVDLVPDLSRPFSNSFLQITPHLRPRFTYYGKSIDADGVASGPALSRPFFEGSLDVRGPNFSRVFNNATGLYTDKIKHTIGPEITWTYRTKVDNFDQIPKFDGYDQLLGTNQFDFAIVQGLYAKRPGPSGKSTAWQFLTWRVQQTYYVQIADNQNEFDPNYSSGYFGPGGVPAHWSPLLSRVNLRPTRLLAAGFDLQYDTNFHQLRSLGLNARLDTHWLALNGGWARSIKVANKVENRVVQSDAIRGGGTLRLVPGMLEIDGTANYDLLLGQVIQYSARLRFNVQCCGLMVERIAYDYNGLQDQVTRFSVQLANIGSFGNFMAAGSNPNSLYGLH